MDIPRFALAGARIFDGDRFLDGHAVVVAGSLVEAVLPRLRLPVGLEVREITGTLAPGFIDTQVNGGGGVLFNDTRTVEGIATIARAHRRFGTTGLLPTFITDTREHMAEAVAEAQGAIDAAIPGVLGIHLEGPFLNPDCAGAHDRRWIRPMTADDVALVTSLKRGVTLLTLAPETVPPATVARLTTAGVLVAAGHTAATPEQITAARQSGLTGVTHLFNAMPPMSARQPGLAGVALAEPEMWAGIIADLHHVSPTSLRVALAARGTRRTILVTDAMPTVGTDLDEFVLQGRRIKRERGRLTTEEGTLAGSDLDMATAVRNVVRELGVPLGEALHMASRAPAEFLGLGERYGRIAQGFRASLVLLDYGLYVTRTWIDGA